MRFSPGNLFKRFFSSGLGHSIAIDLGTANVLFYLLGEGVVLNEPSYVAFSKNKKDVLVGHKAKELWGRTGTEMDVERPLKDGVITDAETTCLMLNTFSRMVMRQRRIVKPRFLVGVSSGITNVEKKAVIETAHMCGARSVNLVEEPVAAAIGCGLPVDDTRGVMVVDVGGGTTEVAIISMGAIAAKTSVRVGGDKIDQAIVDHIRAKHGVSIGLIDAERIKMEIGAAYAMEDSEIVNTTVSGRDLYSGGLKELTVTQKEIAEAIKEPVEAVISAIRATFDKSSHELISDVADRGLSLTGGGALLTGLGELIEERLNIDVTIPPDPLLSVVMGLGTILENVDQYKKLYVN